MLADPKGRALVEEARNGMLSRTIGQASDLALGALRTLDEIRQNAEAPAAARVSACRCMLETLLRAREHGTLSERLAALEQALSSGARPGTLLQAPRDV